MVFVTFIWGSFSEGIRGPQWIFMFVFCMLASAIIFDLDSYVILAIYTVILLLIFLNIFIYGDANFNELKMVGDYQVGHQDIHTSKTGIAVSCYYPMDKIEYDRNIRKRHRNTKWLRYGQSSIKGLTRATADIGS